MKAGSVAVTAAVCLAAGVFIGTNLGGREMAGPGKEEAPAKPAAKPAGDTAAVDALKKNVADLEAAVRAAEMRAESAETELKNAVGRALEAEMRLKETGGESSILGEPELAKADAPKAMFLDYDESLGKVDWKVIGGNMKDMVPLLKELGRALIAGEPLPPKVIGEIQQHNGPLVTAALTLGEKLGNSPNGKFSHPAFMVNAIASTLEAAELPLSESQRTAMESLGTEFMAAEDRRVAAYDDRTWELQKLLDELDSKDRFFTAADALLTAPQKAALTPEETKGRAQVDIFSPALVLAGRVGVDAFVDTAELTEKASTFLRRALKLPDERKDEVTAVVTTWLAGLPSALKEDKGDPLSTKGMVLYTTAQAWGKQQLGLLRAADTALQFDEATRKRAHDVAYISVLFKREE